MDKGKWTCIHAPLQAEGKLKNGNWWYFRARHSAWTFTVGKTLEDAIDENHIFSVYSDYPNASWMEKEVGKRIITGCIKLFLEEQDET